MRYSVSENKVSYNCIKSSIFNNGIIREESAYVDYDQDTLVIKSVLTFKNTALEENTCSAMGAKIRLVTEINVPAVVLDIDGIVVDDRVESTLRLVNDDKEASVDSTKTTVIYNTYNDGFLFSTEYSKLLNMIHIRNKRINNIEEKIYKRDFKWHIDFDVSSKLYTSTIKANPSLTKGLETYTMYIDDSTHAYTHTSAKGIIDELLAVPYTFHGTSINYSSRDYTLGVGHFVVDNVASENEANKIILDIHNKTNNIARFFI